MTSCGELTMVPMVVAEPLTATATFQAAASRNQLQRQSRCRIYRIPRESLQAFTYSIDGRTVACRPTGKRIDLYI
jgi:hypothetical protein